MEDKDTETHSMGASTDTYGSTRHKDTFDGCKYKRFSKGLTIMQPTHTHTPRKATGAGNIATRRVEYPVPDVKPL